MGLILNFGNVISQGCLSPRPTSEIQKVEINNSFSGNHGSDEIKGLKEACEFETFIWYTYTGKVYVFI